MVAAQGLLGCLCNRHLGTASLNVKGLSGFRSQDRRDIINRLKGSPTVDRLHTADARTSSVSIVQRISRLILADLAFLRLKGSR